MQKLLFVLMFLVFTYQGEGLRLWGRRRYKYRVVTKHCYCKAVDADTHRTLHDFRSIQHCTGSSSSCGCGNSAMITCGDACDRRVTNWLESNGWRCRFARTLYTATGCGVPNYGHHRKPCH